MFYFYYYVIKDSVVMRKSSKGIFPVLFCGYFGNLLNYVFQCFVLYFAGKMFLKVCYIEGFHKQSFVLGYVKMLTRFKYARIRVSTDPYCPV